MKYTANEKRYDNMPYRRCGESGLKLPAVSLGLWHNFGDNADYNNMCQMCFTAFDNGITHFDLANNYGPEPGSAETNFGKILHEHLSSYRDEMIISTKAGYYMWPGPYGDFGSKKYLTASLDQSLKRMNLDYVDIFYHHRMDPNTPLYETMWALDSIVKSGKALYVGLSNYDGETMKKAADMAKQEKKGMIIFSPLAQGLLTDRYLKGIPEDSRVRTDGRFLNEKSLSEDKLEKIKQLNQIAKDRGQSLAQMALAWLYHREEITSVLIGASKPEQIIENLAMINNLNFTDGELKQIDSIAL